MRLKICKIRFGHVFLCNALCNASKVSKQGFIKNIFREKSGTNNSLFLLWTHLSKKRKNLSLNNHFFATTETIYGYKSKNKFKGNMGI